MTAPRRTWQTLLNESLAGIYPALEEMTDAELKRVKKAGELRSSTNCWWVAYEAAPLLADIAGMVLRARQMKRRREKRNER